MKGRILSGMRPTGNLHVGHYKGVLENWASLQDDYECYYMIADWHALMSEYKDSSSLAEYSYVVAAEWIACGLDPERSTLFVQSHLPAHSELHLILSCITPLGWLERCPTYKEQLQQLQHKEVNTYAFLGYPVLQAADILLYRADTVPVGEDQLPHLELSREIARRFNSLFGEVFPEPKAKLTRSPRILGTDRRKMSKSYGNAIELADEADAIGKKIGGMITDPERIRKTDPGRPEVCNVHSYYEIFVPAEVEMAGSKCRAAEWGCTDCKRHLAERMNDLLRPIREKRNELLAERGRLDEILANGNKKAAAMAGETMRLVRQAVKF